MRAWELSSPPGGKGRERLSQVVPCPGPRNPLPQKRQGSSCLLPLGRGARLLCPDPRGSGQGTDSSKPRETVSEVSWNISPMRAATTQRRARSLFTVLEICREKGPLTSYPTRLRPSGRGWADHSFPEKRPCLHGFCGVFFCFVLNFVFCQRLLVLGVSGRGYQAGKETFVLNTDKIKVKVTLYVYKAPGKT